MKAIRLKTKFEKRALFITLLFLGLWAIPQNTFAHCDSYDGPVVKDALIALENNDARLVMKWVDAKYEKEIIDLFTKTMKYRAEDKEIYGLIEKHFLETLVRFHREGEGEPYTGLKPAGSTKQIIQLTDIALVEEDFDGFLLKFNGHVNTVLKKKYEKVTQLKKVKDQSPQNGREFVAAYVDYTHTIERMHDILLHTGSSHEKH